MKNKVWSLVLVLMVAMCGMVFVACGGETPGTNVSLTISSGLDSELSSAQLSNLSDELSLNDFEKSNIEKGLGYDAKVATDGVITLIIGSENFEYRDVIVNINGWKEGMGSLVSFSSDSSKIKISQVEYLYGGRAKVRITGLESGTAEITAISGQYSKSINFTVKILELPTHFSIKRDAVIYLEKNSRLTINPEDYIDFYPITTNMKDLEFYIGTTLLTKNGKTTISSISGEDNYIDRDTILTVKSTRIKNEESVQVIEIRVIDDIKQLEIKKLVYTENENVFEKDYALMSEEEILTVVINSSKGSGDNQITYGIREVFLIVKNSEAELEVKTKAFINNLERDIIIPAPYKEFITEETENSEYFELIEEYIEGLSQYAFHIFKFDIQYGGYDDYDIEFSFKVGNYTYANTKNLKLSFKTASSLVEFKRDGDAEQKSNYTIYDSYSGVFGTRFTAKTNVAALPYNLQLVFDVNVYNNLVFLSTTGAKKNAVLSGGQYVLSLKNNESIYIAGGEGSEGNYSIKAKVVYTHDNITFEKSEEIEIKVLPAPSKLEFNLKSIPSYQSGEGIEDYDFDLNISGKRLGSIGNIDYMGNKYLSLYLYTYGINGNYIGDAEDFIIQNTSRLISIVRDEVIPNKINITALATGSGNFTVVLGNNVKQTFSFNIIESISEFQITFPGPEQNNNVFSLRKNYSYQGNTYSNYLIAVKGKNIPVLINNSGNIKSISVQCVEPENNNCITYTNGYIKTNKDFNYSEVKITITYNYISDNQVVEATEIVDKILVSSITNISNFSILTKENTNSFTLYDYSSVGFHSINLAQKVLNVRIDPSELKNDLFREVEWSSNVEVVSEKDNGSYFILDTEIFRFEYTKSTGVGILLCKIDPLNYEKYYDENGKFKLGTIILTGRINRENGDYGTYSKSVQFNVRKNEKTEVMISSTSDVHLDSYENKKDIKINLFPANSVNQNLAFLFFSNELTTQDIVWNESPVEGNSRKLTIELKNNDVKGEGVLRIIAMDSAFGEISFSEVKYTKYIDINIIVADGSSDAPFVINSTQSVQKMIYTEFAKYYKVHGSIDLSKTNWEFNKYILKGRIVGENNAEFIGVNITDNESENMGLFAEISASATISNIKISGSINIENISASNSTPIYIGLLSGINKGTIENVFVELNGGSVKVIGDYYFGIGGVVGLNQGEIKTIITENSTYTRLVNFKNYFEFVDKSGNDGNKLYLGGAVGVNEGIISRKVSEGLTEFNNNFATAEVYIRAYYENTIPNSAQVGIGGISGISHNASNTVDAAGIYGVVAIGEIVAGKLTESTFAGHFDNVGGIVGDNKLAIQGSISKVYVRGRNSVGGAVGENREEITAGNFGFGIKVEALEKSNNKNGFNASFIIGEDNVGGIVGNQVQGDLKSSSFISYIDRKFVSQIDNSSVDYLGDILIIESKYGTVNFGLIFGNVYELTEAGENKYIVGVGNIQFIDVNANYNTEQNPISISKKSGAAGYATFGMFIDQNSSEASEPPRLIKEGLFENDKYGEYNDYFQRYGALETLKEDNTGFEFIIMPPNEANIELGTDGKENRLYNEDNEDEESEELALFLYYYKSENNDYHDKTKNLNLLDIGNYISIGDLYGASIKVVEGISLLEINASNQFVVKGIGKVVLEITTPYNLNISKKVYVYIINYINNISAYRDSEYRNEIDNDSEIRFDATENTPIYFYFLDRFNVYELTEATGVSVFAKVVIGDKTYIIKPDGEINENAKFGLIRESYNVYKIIVNKEVIDIPTSIEFIPYIEVSFGNLTFTNYLTEGNNSEIIKTENDNVIDKINNTSGNLQLKNKVKFKYKLVNLTKSISVSNNEISFEPYYEEEISVIFNSSDNNEKLTIRVEMLNANGVVDTSFKPGWLKVVARWNGKVAENITNGDRKSIFSLDGINTTSSNLVSVLFQCGDGFKEFSEEQTFIITFISNNSKMATVRLKLIPQKQSDITTTLYDAKSPNDTHFNFPGYFSYIPSNFMIPGQTSLIEFNIVPSYTYYEFIEITNIASNEKNILFDLFNRTESETIPGAIKIENGIRIPKNIIANANGTFFLRTFLDSKITDNSNISIKITLKDENGNEISPNLSKEVMFYVQHLPGVVLTVDGVSSGNTNSNRVRLARGLSYDLLVSVKGYTSGNLIKNGNVYTDGELVFEITGDANLITIVKSNDGSYKLVITGNPILERKIEITTYGMKNTGDGIEKSREATIYIEIDEFVVKNLSSLGDIVQGVINNVYSTAIGNSYTFNISLNNNILFYDATSFEIVSKVEKFLEDLSREEGVWFYQDLSRTATTWTKVSSENTAFIGSGDIKQYTTNNGVFTLEFNAKTGELKIHFKKAENSNSPTFKFRFSAKYHYEEGLPTFISNTATAIDSLTLEQVFAFDVRERTDSRNPYPIYSYEELIDMREGNYYILLNDIVLPSNFTPITTKIGGLDGNNHRIIFRDMDIIGNEEYGLSFGLFSETAEDTLLNNIILYLEKPISITTYNYNNIVLGLLVGTNYGVITNCAVEGATSAVLNVRLIGVNPSGDIANEIGGLAGINYGSITHSRIEAGIVVNNPEFIGASYMNANLGGITSINKSGGTIASSYVNARIENNTTSFLAKTGGVVSINEIDARIFTTYISGEYTSRNATAFADDLKVIVYSSASAGAFVYENSGIISNCYANIRMITVEASSGFVFQNKERGEISYCYSTSIVAGNAANSAFVGIIKGDLGESSILNDGNLIECYYLDKIEIPDGNNKIIYNEGIGSNSGVKSGLIKVENNNKFSDQAQEDFIFGKFAFSETIDKSDGVWFMPNLSGAENYFMRDGQPMTFRGGKPELVAPNIIAAGNRTLREIVYNIETGITEYKYNDPNDNNYKQGGKYNPYIIANAEDMENIKENAHNFIIQEAHYRIVCDIIYESSTTSSELYKYSFIGKVEGNNFTIGNYILDSVEELDYSGFFATLGTQANQNGSIKNLTFAPRYVSLTNANCVGAIAGRAYSTILINVSVDGFKYSSSPKGVIILGKNCVGGVIGIASGNYRFNEVYSNISVNSTYRAVLNNHAPKSMTDLEIDKVSFAGLIVGALEGTGRLRNIYVFGNNLSIGEHAALVFGYVGRNVSANGIKVESASGQYIKADVYGGIVAGQNEGVLKNIEISSTKDTFFITENFVATALGNIVGYMTGGKIEGAELNLNIQANTSVKYVGGAVGLMRAGELIDVKIKGKITAGSTIGGLVGQVLNSAKSWRIKITDSYHKGDIISTSNSATVRIGTLIGYADIESSKIALELNSPSTNQNANIFIKMTEDFIEEMGTVPKNTIYLTNYVYSRDIQLWLGIIICKATDATDKGVLSIGYNYDAPPLASEEAELTPEEALINIYGISEGSKIIIAYENYSLNGKKYPEQK